MADAYRRLGWQAANLDDPCRAAIDDSSARLDKLLCREGESAGEQAERRERLARLDGALEQLPPDWREVVELKYLHGQSVPEIATATDRTKDAVAGLLHRGVRRLRELMDEPDER